MNIDIEEARQKADFSIDSMLNMLRGGEEAVKKLNDLRQLAENEPIFSKAETPFQSRQEVSAQPRAFLLIFFLTHHFFY